MEALKIYRNQEDGIESVVTVRERGIYVMLKDLDAGEFLPTAKIFKHEDRSLALAYARKLMGPGWRENEKIRQGFSYTPRGKKSI